MQYVLTTGQHFAEVHGLGGWPLKFAAAHAVLSATGFAHGNPVLALARERGLDWLPLIGAIYAPELIVVSNRRTRKTTYADPVLT